ncbi:MAG: L,D-transpeptidase family protein [Gammaproteobacteria bacterium]|nr:L,D-transpeptidase family protein [Gammaproteobacteria bacterium]MDH5652444.1 L,D-transpeptidase family protein [Gammaproteobacteria bacterium]
MKLQWKTGILTGLVATASMAIYAAGFQQEESSTQRIIEAGQANPNLQKLMQQLDKRIAGNTEDYEAGLLKVLITFNKGMLDQAIAEVDALIKRAPDFHLAHLVKGDLLLARVGQVSDIGENPILQKLGREERERLQLLRDEAYARLRASLSRQLGNKVPLQLMNLAPSVDIAVLVEKGSNRLYIYEHDGDGRPPRLVRDYYVSTGKVRGDKVTSGDLKTPEGVYFVTAWIPDEKLPTKYGIGAFPVNYPNEYDMKLGKTGHGIWLHGVDNGFYSRPPLDSEGCVVLPNIDLQGLKKEIKPGVTPVVITEQASWVTPLEWQQYRESVLSALEKWRADWESMDVEAYLSHYDNDFWSNSHTLKSWAARKRLVAQGKTWQKVKLSDISLLAYPDKTGTDPMVVARFRQRYTSNNYQGDLSKRIYLRKQGSEWRILYEGG